MAGLRRGIVGGFWHIIALVMGEDPKGPGPYAMTSSRANAPVEKNSFFIYSINKHLLSTYCIIGLGEDAQKRTG